MARLSPKFSFLRRYFVIKRGQSSGFTLLELLVALIIGSIITFLMLFTVIELLKTNQREAARSDTQRDVQAAIDYIARDLREAVYVYDAKCLNDPANNGNPGPKLDTCPGLMSGLLPTSWSAGLSANRIPVLAFWRVDPLPTALVNLCKARNAAFGDATPSDADIAAVSGVACISRRTYTLVIYSVEINAPNDAIWKGKARLTRYELPQFPSTQATPGTVTRTAGWASPVQDGGGFYIWPFTANNGNTQTTAGSQADFPVVLVDFIHNGTATAVTAANPNAGCPAGAQPYIRSNNAVSGFYVCVNGANLSTQNQEVIVYLQGNAVGKPGITSDVIIPLETRVMTRGALQKGGS
jgi:prepilin-type N-terminal cleavage/methylation domain-containing protein